MQCPKRVSRISCWCGSLIAFFDVPMQFSDPSFIHCIYLVYEGMRQGGFQCNPIEIPHFLIYTYCVPAGHQYFHFVLEIVVSKRLALCLKISNVSFTEIFKNRALKTLLFFFFENSMKFHKLFFSMKIFQNCMK